MVIRFVKGWRGRKPGETDSQLGSGSQNTLIRYGFAERVVDGTQRVRRRRRKVTPAGPPG